MLQDSLIFSVENITNYWVLDSRVVFHAKPHRKHFHDYVHGNFGQVCLGDERPLDIIGKGKVLINLENGNQWLLKYLKHVVDLRKNLISRGQLEGCVTTFTYKTWKVTKGALVVAKGEKLGTLYLCKGNFNSTIALASTGIDTTLWHHKLGHMNEKGMQILQSRKLLPSLKKIDLEFCEHCGYGK